ncbi:MAG TPA: 23S rRNA (adenine(2030)-N(6))-methyltransferase RlmJ, partial [Alphaproteobacteria bacterium]|nr:23S rRNA (adenine(2030)-N(6))-methyltransferase RlmJ [Alphaproteobacteria bacterium]
LILVELHPEDVANLRAGFRGDPQVAVHHRDAYEALKALLPLPERRGLVLIDPTFEVTDEFARMVTALSAAHRRWPSGIYALWYPIKHRPPVDRFHGDLAMTGIGRVLAVELTVYDDAPPDRLNGSGLLIINPPWRLEDRLREVLPPVQRLLSQSGGRVRIEWLAPE